MHRPLVFPSTLLLLLDEWFRDESVFRLHYGGPEVQVAALPDVPDDEPSSGAGVERPWRVS
jgi:hypothetical protein